MLYQFFILSTNFQWQQALNIRQTGCCINPDKPDAAIKFFYRFDLICQKVMIGSDTTLTLNGAITGNGYETYGQTDIIYCEGM